MTGRVKIHDVADAAGVSVTTVSHALSGQGKVSARTRDRVRQVALELGYAPNRIASALRRRQSDIVGFVSDEVATTPFAGRIVLGAQDAAADHGKTLMVVNSNRNRDVEHRQVGVLLAQQVDAILYATMFHRRVEAPNVPHSVPVVLINAVSASIDLPSFVPDEVALAAIATRALIDAGHSRIAHLTIHEPGYGTDGRVRGYRRVMLDAGLRPHVVAPEPGPADARYGWRALEAALVQDPGLTAVFCFNDPMAMGVYQASAERGLRIPEDLSVVGVDDLEIISSQLRPGLTTVALPHYEMGRRALAEAVRRFEDGGEGEAARLVRLECPVVHRGSVAAPRRLAV